MPRTTNQPLDRYIDRFLFADGWRVTAVDSQATPGLIAVTLTKGSEPNMGRAVTRRATSAGEATFMACSSARQLTAPVAEAVN